MKLDDLLKTIFFLNEQILFCPRMYHVHDATLNQFLGGIPNSSPAKLQASPAVIFHQVSQSFECMLYPGL